MPLSIPETSQNQELNVLLDNIATIFHQPNNSEKIKQFTDEFKKLLIQPKDDELSYSYVHIGAASDDTAHPIGTWSSLKIPHATITNLLNQPIFNDLSTIIVEYPSLSRNNSNVSQISLVDQSILLHYRSSSTIMLKKYVTLKTLQNIFDIITKPVFRHEITDNMPVKYFQDFTQMPLLNQELSKELSKLSEAATPNELKKGISFLKFYSYVPNLKVFVHNKI